MAAFFRFGLPTEVIFESEFLDTESQDVFTFGRPPVALDLLTKVRGLDFAGAYAHAEQLKADDGQIGFLHLNELRQAKRAAARRKDLDDLEHLPLPET